jgi:hypothetical protein
MDALFSTVPWNTPALWQAANAGLSIAISRNRPAMAGLIRQALAIRRQYEAIFPHMDHLCRRTCPACSDRCCRRAWVWADFNDLLFLHLAGIDPPRRQLLHQKGDQCRYAGADGCRLNRIQRPFVCTWYLCPAQTRILNGLPNTRKTLTAAINQIKTARHQMENRFMAVVAGK